MTRLFLFKCGWTPSVAPKGKTKVELTLANFPRTLTHHAGLLKSLHGIFPAMPVIRNGSGTRPARREVPSTALKSHAATR